MSVFLSFLRRLLVLSFILGLVPAVALADEALRDFQGNITTLEALQSPDKWTVVMIWASDCPVCNEEAGGYSAFHSAHADKDAKIIGISIDGQAGLADAEDYIQRNGVTYPNLIGDVGAVARWYQNRTGQSFRATPTFVVFDPAGEVQAAQPGAVPPNVIEDFIASKR